MYHFIVNIHGSSGKAFLKWNKIRELLKARKVDFKVHVPQRVGHAMQIAKEVSSMPEDDIKNVMNMRLKDLNMMGVKFVSLLAVTARLTKSSTESRIFLALNLA